MKTLSLLLVLSLAGFQAQASEITTISCHSSTRVTAGDLDIDLDLSKKLLTYEIYQSHSVKPSLSFKKKGSNQDGFGLSPLSKSSLSIAHEGDGLLKVKAVGKYYDRATLMKTDVIEVVVDTSGDTFSVLKSFKINGFDYTFDALGMCHVF